MGTLPFCCRPCGKALASCHVRADTDTEVVLLQSLGQGWERRGLSKVESLYWSWTHLDLLSPCFYGYMCSVLIKKTPNPQIFWHHNKHIDLADECLSLFFKSLNFKHIGELCPCAQFIFPNKTQNYIELQMPLDMNPVEKEGNHNMSCKTCPGWCVER